MIWHFLGVSGELVNQARMGFRVEEIELGYRDNWTNDRVIMRSGPGEFKRELGETIKIDTSYSGVPDGAGQ